jgi:hypothetical protein
VEENWKEKTRKIEYLAMKDIFYALTLKSKTGKRHPNGRFRG